MHDNHKHHSHSHGHAQGALETLRELEATLEHWLEHDAAHGEQCKAWAAKASEAGEEEIAKEIHLAVQENGAAKSHLKRAKAILAAKLVLIK